MPSRFVRSRPHDSLCLPRSENCPVYMKFKGGKGIAATAGLVTAFDWRFMLVALVLFCIAFFLTPAGAAPCNALTICGNCGNTTRSCGRGCGIWTTGRGHSLAPVPWGSLSRIGAWSGWRNALPVRKRRAAPDVLSPSSGGSALVPSTLCKLQKLERR